MLTLFRSQTFQVQITKPDSVRAFVFEVEVGIGKSEPSVDPMSGMLLNLVEIDAVMAALHNYWQSQAWSSLEVLLRQSREFLEAALAKHRCSLVQLTLREKRGFWLRSEGVQPTMGFAEIREMNGGLYRLSSESLFVESQLEMQSLNLADTAVNEEFFKRHPHLQSVLLENLGNTVKHQYRRA